MKLAYFKPCSILSEFVGDYYLFETPVAGRQPLCAELGNIRFVLGGGGRIVWSDGRQEPFRPMTVVGPTMSAYAIDADPGARAIGIGVTPRGWDALFGFSSHALRDQSADLLDCLRTEARQPARACFEQLGEAADDATLAVAIDEFLWKAIAARIERLRRFPAQLERWLLSPAVTGVDELVASLDVSRRQTDRLAKHYFGASPKGLQRKYRALHALRRLPQPGQVSHWWDAAGDFYYDQSHFIRDFKEFIGATPGAYLAAYLADEGGLLARSISLRARTTHKPAIAEEY